MRYHKVHEVKPSTEIKEIFAKIPLLKYGEHAEAIRIGAFRLVRMSTGGIWIGEADGGESGEFKEAEIEKAIHKFYADNF